MRTLILCGSLTLMCFANVNAAGAAPRFTVERVSLNVPGRLDLASDLSDRGQISGNIQVPNGGGGFLHAPALQRNGMVTLLPGIAPGDNGTAYGVNTAGDAVGYADNGYAGVRWKDGKVEDLSVYVGGPSIARRINDAGTLIGETSTGVSYSLTGNTVTPLRNSEGGGATTRALNESGTVVGFSERDGASYAIEWNGGVPRELPRPAGDYPSYPLTEANDVNDSGVVVGNIGDPNFSYSLGRAVRWTNGVSEVLPSLPWITLFGAQAINNDGWIVGLGFTGNVREYWRALLWTDEGVFDLNDLVPDLGGDVLAVATRVNNRGQILVFGVSGEEYGGLQSQYLLTPVPTPSSSLLVLCISGFALKRRARPRVTLTSLPPRPFPSDAAEVQRR